MIPPNVAFLYWGRRGFSRFMLEAAGAARELGLNAYISVSTTNELYDEFKRLGDTVFPVDTFHTSLGALLKTPQVLALRYRLVDWLAERQVEAVISLMPHIWTPLVSPALQRRGMRYAVIIHDARPHPGDPTGLIYKWLLTDAKSADTVVTLSEFVRDELIKKKITAPDRIKTVFMPDLVFPHANAQATINARKRSQGSALRVLTFGRLLRYKGLPLFVDAMKILAAKGIRVEISVCGEGDLDGMMPQLQSLGAVVINRWLADDEIGQLLACHDVVVLTHIEASQSGIISAALGAGVPVVATPVGGLAEQVLSRGGGLVSKAVDAQSVAESVALLATDSALYNGIIDRIGASAGFSMKQFLRELIAAILSNTGSAPGWPPKASAQHADRAGHPDLFVPS